MKNYSLLIKVVVCCAFGLIPSLSHAQRRTLTTTQLDAIVKPNLAQCKDNFASKIDAASIIPTTNAREFPANRITKTLHGIWTGRIVGYNKDLSVDYFWIFDTRINQSLIIALRNGKQTVPTPKDAANAPRLIYLLCAHEGYTPTTETPMLHEFVKVADSIDDAPRIVEKATGVKFRKARPTLADLWQGLLAAKYFESMPAEAFAGALFKPVQLGRVASAAGPAGFSLRWNSEYRGGGSTSIKYVTGLPMMGVEHGEFVGTTTDGGDYLVSSPGNGKIWKVEASMATNRMPTTEQSKTFPIVCYDLAFDKVVLGPLQSAAAPTSERQKRR